MRPKLFKGLKDWWDRPNVLQRTKRKLAMVGIVFLLGIGGIVFVAVALANWIS